jgi:hypothetical protein
VPGSEEFSPRWWQLRHTFAVSASEGIAFASGVAFLRLKSERTWGMGISPTLQIWESKK